MKPRIFRAFLLIFILTGLIVIKYFSGFESAVLVALALIYVQVSNDGKE